jgi:glycosyltransferase involved in cell wall biosynthesis
MTKPSIAILHYAAPPTIGGVEFTIAAHARLFADHGYAVRVVTGRGEPFDARVPVDVIADVGSSAPRVLLVNAELKQGKVSDEFDTLVQDLTVALAQHLNGVTHLIAHNALTLHKNLALTVALHNLLEKHLFQLIAWCHDFAWTDPQYAADMHAGRPWVLLARPWEAVQYVVVSEARRDELLTLFSRSGGARPPNIAVVPGGIDPFEFLGVTERVAKWARDLGLAEASPLLLLPARLTRRKNIEYAIEITAALCRRGLEPKLVVTGPPGPHNPTNTAYLDKLRAMRRGLGVEQAVIFLHEFGEVYGDAMRDLYLLADALLFPSEREGFGIPILEAGLARLPIFCSDLPPFHETAGANAHYFAPGESADSAAEKIADHLGRDAAYLLKRHILTDYTWERLFSESIEPLVERRL